MRRRAQLSAVALLARSELIGDFSADLRNRKSKANFTENGKTASKSGKHSDQEKSPHSFKTFLTSSSN
jgi:hypothetical protein